MGGLKHLKPGSKNNQQEKKYYTLTEPVVVPAISRPQTLAIEAVLMLEAVSLLSREKG